jgi:uncharacterized protein YicC (UPF0701 family)
VHTNHKFIETVFHLPEGMLSLEGQNKERNRNRASGEAGFLRGEHKKRTGSGDIC